MATKPTKRKIIPVIDPAILQALRDSIVAVPRESIDGLVDTIHKQDAVELMQRIPDESVELVFTDEPFAIQKSVIVFNCRTDMGRDLAWDLDTPAHLRIPWVYEAFRILKPGGSLLNWFTAEWATSLRDVCVNAGFEWKASIFWCKTNSAPQVRKQNYRSSHECLFWAAKGPIKDHFNFGPQQEMKNWLAETVCPYCHAAHPAFHSNHYSEPAWWTEFSGLCNDRDRQHPTQKPEWAISKYMMIHSNQGDIIVDPFCGSGIIPYVAQRLGRHYIASDSDERWYEYSTRQLSAEQVSIYGG